MEMKKPEHVIDRNRSDIEAYTNLVKPRRQDSAAAKQAKIDMEAIKRGKFGETKAESWRKLGLNRIRGQLK